MVNGGDDHKTVRGDHVEMCGRHKYIPSPYLISVRVYTKIQTKPQRYKSPAIFSVWLTSPRLLLLPHLLLPPNHVPYPPRLSDRSLQALQARARAHKTSRQQKPSWYASYACNRLGAAETLTTATEHIVRETIDTVNQAIGSPSSSESRGREPRRPESAGFAEFAANVIGRAEIPTTVLLVTLIYIYRSRPHLSVEAEEWALHRVFLGALVLASKVCVVFQIINPARLSGLISC